MPRPSSDADAAAARRLRAETEGEVLFDAGARGRYATDASIYQIVPRGVFVPRTDRDVGIAIDIARDLGIPVLARGAGSSQCGQTTGESLVVDTTKHLRRIVDVDVAGRTATVQPGVVLDALNARLKADGLWFPVDVSTSAQATIGGMAGNNSCGSRSLAWGNMVHNVLGIEAWLADGSIQRFGPVDGLVGRAAAIGQAVRDLALRHGDEIDARWPTVLRRVGGYNLDVFRTRSERPYTPDGSVNLAHLLVGSEGTLAFSRSLTLKLAELPRAKVLGVVNFPTFRGAMEAARHLVALGPTAVELVDRTMVDLALANPAFAPTMRAAVVGDPQALLLVEFCGDAKAGLGPRLDRLVECVGDLRSGASVVRMPDDAAQKALWEVRKAGLNIMMSLKGDGKPVSFIEDCAVPLEHLADYTDALTEVFARHGTRGTWYAHASVGTLHVRPILDMRTDGAARMRAIAEEASALVRRYKGAFSGEHGDGLCRGEWIAWQFGPTLVEAFRAIKRTFDPDGLFAPNRIVDPPRMDEAALFRFPPAAAPQPYRRIAIAPALDWSPWNVSADPVTEATTAPGTGGDATGGFAKAVEMCNNNGHCRKFDAGTMCPSFRVTRDERHSTRGRANTLRLALSNQLGPDALTGDDLFETLDLCVSCKGCRRECPTGVDMAKMKIEFLAGYKGQHGFTAKDRLVARLPDYASLLSRMPAIANLRDTLPAVARAGERWLGLAASRRLPRWRRDTFWRSDARHSLLADAEATLAAARAGRKAAVLFVDTWNGTFETENALAAARLLHRAGYAVHVPERGGGRQHCCGRTFLASGMVPEAKARVRDLVEALHPFAEAGVAVVGLEPSCLLTLRDEALVLGLGPKAETVAGKAVLLEEFLAAEARDGRFDLRFTPSPAKVLLHGHCHQKAFDAVAPILDVLKRVPGAEPELVETSCCGMAGSFGYEARHLEVSRSMAEASLLPALRARPDAIVVADGTSCRAQIAGFGDRVSVHAAVFLERQSRDAATV